MGILRCCLLFTCVIFSLQQFVASQFLIDEVLRRGVNDLGLQGNKLAFIVYKFTVDIYEELIRSDEDSNVFFSPINIYFALAMIYEGSIKETNRQLASVLLATFFYSDDDYSQAIKRLLDRFSTADKTFTLTMASRFYSQVGINISDGYQKLMRDYFDAGVQSVDFKTDPAGCKSEINGWSEKETWGKVRNLFPANAITNDTGLVLTNAVHFKGSWSYKLNADKTVNRHRRQQEELVYASQSNSYKLVEFPFSNRNFSMVIVLEEKPDGFKEFLREKRQGYQPIHVFTDTSLESSLPKFKLQQTVNLKRTLQVLGLKNLFENAKLAGISDSAHLQFTDAYHESFFVADESGTEAAQATGFKAATSNSDSIKDDDTIDFIVDRPFMFLIYEKTTGCILFFGYIKNPLKTN